ncbi:hypothetical protein Taro_001039, partial [Colocasia esculenta]|nr:hypothetical protein [Colocasia esculenta]
MIYVFIFSGTIISCKGGVDTTIKGVDTMAQSKDRNVKKRSTSVDTSPGQGINTLLLGIHPKRTFSEPPETGCGGKRVSPPCFASSCASTPQFTLLQAQESKIDQHEALGSTSREQIKHSFIHSLRGYARRGRACGGGGMPKSILLRLLESLWKPSGQRHPPRHQTIQNEPRMGSLGRTVPSLQCAPGSSSPDAYRREEEAAELPLP